MGKIELRQAIEQAKAIVLQDAKVKEAWNIVKSIKSFKSFMLAFASFWILLKAVVMAVEIVQAEYKLCTKDERIDVASELLDELVEFKGWFSIFEPFDDILFKLLISSAVQGINDLLGKDWMNKLVSENIKDRSIEMMHLI